MKCKCVTEIQKNLPKEQTFKGKEIESAEVEAGIISMKDKEGKGRLELVTCSTITLRVAGMARKQTMTMIHQYCPFCGIKIEE